MEPNTTAREALYLDLLKEYIDLIASRPEDAVIEFRVSRGLGRADNIDIVVADCDYGVFIGRHAAHIKSLQSIFKAIADAQRTPLAIAVREPQSREVHEMRVREPQPDLLTDVANWVFSVLAEIDPAADVEEVDGPTGGEDTLIVRSTRLGDLGGPIRTLVWAISAGHGRRIKTEFSEVPKA